MAQSRSCQTLLSPVAAAYYRHSMKSTFCKRNEYAPRPQNPPHVVIFSTFNIMTFGYKYTPDPFDLSLHVAMSNPIQDLRTPGLLCIPKIIRRREMRRRNIKIYTFKREYHIGIWFRSFRTCPLILTFGLLPDLADRIDPTLPTWRPRPVY